MDPEADPTPAAEEEGEGVDHPTVICSPTQAAPRTFPRLQLHSGSTSVQDLKTPTPQEVVVKFQNVGGGFLGIKDDGQLVIDNSVITTHKLQCVTFIRRWVHSSDGRPVITLQSEKYQSKWITGHTENCTVDGKPHHIPPSSSSRWLQVSYSTLFPGSQIGEHWQALQYWGSDREQNLYFIIKFDQSSHLQFLLSPFLDEVKKYGAFYIDTPPQ